MSALTSGECGNISISATSHALLAMEHEIVKLQQEEERLMDKRKLLLAKMASCHAVIKKLLLTTGAQYKYMDHPKFPTLNGD